jgi:hypothetical protein
MSATNARLAAVSALLLLAGTACFYTTAPKGWLPTAAEAQRDAYGGWIMVEYKAGVQRRTVQGELIAATQDSVHVLTADSIVALPTPIVISGTLTAYDAKVRTLQLWTVLGAVSTLSHGAGLILSAPVWLIAGVSATAAASKAPRVESTKPGDIRAYARFPQGIPPGLDPRSLRQKDIRALARR